MQSHYNYCHICKEKCELTLCKKCYIPLFKSIEQHVSFAFDEDIPKEIDAQDLQDSIVLDCFKCGLTKAEITNFTQLRQLRLSHCQNLTKIRLKELPNLISLDAFDSPNLSEFTIIQVPNLISIDLSFCPNLTQINGEFPKVEYFSISNTKIDKLPSLPMVKFVNISSTKINELKPLYSSQKLQKLIMLNNFQIKSIEMIHFVRHPDFSSIITTSLLDFQNCPAKHSLKNMVTSGAPLNSDQVDFSGTNMDYFESFEKAHLSFEEPIFSGDWYESYRLIYGPYPTPPKDSKPFLSSSEIESIYNIFPLPEKVDPTLTSHHIMGSLFGAAIGDCLGIYCEGNDTMSINFFNDQPLDITWTHPITSRNGRYLHRGSFTDDTALMLTFLRAVVSTAIENLSKSKDELQYIFDPCEAARRIHHWIDNGIDEHLDGEGFGRGGCTTRVVHSKCYDENPIDISRSV